MKRFDVVSDDFVLIGPKADPANVRANKDIAAGLKAIYDKGAEFVSRGDKSGARSAELALWKAAGPRSSRCRASLVSRDRPGRWGPR